MPKTLLRLLPPPSLLVHLERISFALFALAEPNPNSEPSVWLCIYGVDRFAWSTLPTKCIAGHIFLASPRCTRTLRRWQGLVALLSSDFFFPPLLAVEIGCQRRSLGSFLPLCCWCTSKATASLFSRSLNQIQTPSHRCGSVSMGSTASLGRLSPLSAWLAIFSRPALGAPRTLQRWQGLVALLSSDFFFPPLLAVEIGCQRRSFGSFLPLHCFVHLKSNSFALSALAEPNPNSEPWVWLCLYGVNRFAWSTLPTKCIAGRIFSASPWCTADAPEVAGPCRSLVLRFLFPTALGG